MGGGRRRGRAYDVLVVGAGFAGSIMAERAAASGLRVLVIDKRDHIAGNAFDEYDAHGVLIHRYGPHIFHTSSDKVSAYLSRFTAWRPYEHRVLASLEGKLVPVPINRTTINVLHGKQLVDDAEVEIYLQSQAARLERTVSSEDAVVGKVGRDLYERLFRGYTRKQWGLDPRDLDASVCGRIPVRFDDDDRYFTDSFQNMPAEGYTRMFERILDHPLIDTELATDFDRVSSRIVYRRLVWTGPIDSYYHHRYGRLPYRSLEFEFKTQATTDAELAYPVGQVNFPSEDVAYTRLAEYRHLTGQAAAVTTLSYEYPRAEGDPYYPIPRAENRELYHRYEALAKTDPDVIFVGRLARYQYLNMDQVVAQALQAAATAFGKETRAGSGRVIHSA
jgi:UDP-galactopyranose mutase